MFMEWTSRKQKVTRKSEIPDPINYVHHVNEPGIFFFCGKERESIENAFPDHVKDM